MPLSDDAYVESKRVHGERDFTPEERAAILAARPVPGVPGSTLRGDTMTGPTQSGTPMDDRCSLCGVSKQQVLGVHDAQRQEVDRLRAELAVWHADREEGERLVALVRDAAPFVNAVAAMADDKAPALEWLIRAASAVGIEADA